MIQQKHFTGRWKNMNMAKLGTVLLENPGMEKYQDGAKTRMNKGLRAIHYANFTFKNGDVLGFVLTTICMFYQIPIYDYIQASFLPASWSAPVEPVANRNAMSSCLPDVRENSYDFHQKVRVHPAWEK